jgi:hypothetical protein
MARCSRDEPVLAPVEGRLVACHLYDTAAQPVPAFNGADRRVG